MNVFQMACMRLKRDTEVTQYEIFNAEINYERGFKVKIDVGSRHSGRSDGKKQSLEEAQVTRKNF